jgi:hypothetical protein
MSGLMPSIFLLAWFQDVTQPPAHDQFFPSIPGNHFTALT